MNDVPLSTFQEAIQATHGAKARLVERVRVVEDFEGERVWEGEVLVFNLENHPEASQCYAWEVDGQVTAVLDTGPVNSPLAAVRASILADTEPPRVAPSDWIRIGNVDAVICQEYDGGTVEVVYLDWRDRAINEDAVWADGEWEFEHEGAYGRYADRNRRLSEFVHVLRRGRFP